MDNRAGLLNCALDLFAARGYDAVGVQEVVDAAGVTKPTLYHYFGSKQGLLEALLAQYQSPFLAEVRRAAEYQGDLPLTLNRLALAFFQFARANPVFYRMQLALAFAAPGSPAHQAALRWNTELFAVIEGVFSAAVKDHGNMRGRHRLYGSTFIGLLNTCVSLWLNGALALDDDLAYQVTRQFQHGIYS